MNLVRSELLKIRTTSTWWWLALGAFLSIALAFAINAWLVVTALGGDAEERSASAPSRRPRRRRRRTSTPRASTSG